MAGRQADQVVLSPQARTFLKGQVRRHKAPRSLSDRYRMVLLCADGLQSKEVAARMGLHEHTVGKWRRRFVEDGIERRTHIYVRNGTISLFAALDIATGAVIGKCYKRNSATEFLDFLKRIDAEVPDDLDVHLVMDNYATHETSIIKTWLARRPNWHVHFTPTSASWINQVERWFAELTRKQLQRSAHRSTADLEAHITAFIEVHNENPKPYRWAKTADQILASVKRFCHKTMRPISVPDD